MSNIKPNSVIALLDDLNHIKTVLDTSIWVAGRLGGPIGLLHCNPSNHNAQAIDYSGCLTIDNDEQMLQDFSDEEYQRNLAIKNSGKALLAKAQTYCAEHFCSQETYPLHRQCRIDESIDYIDNQAELIITAPKLTCKTTFTDVLRHSHCPVLVTHSPFKTPESALFAFDNKETCHRLLDWVCHSPMTRNMHIHVVMVGKDTVQNRDAIREAYAKLTQAGVKCSKKLLNYRDVPSALIYYQKEHSLDMLMSGAFGQSRLREWLQGSETEKLLNSRQTHYLLYPKYS